MTSSPLSKHPHSGCLSSARPCGTSAWTTPPLSWLVRRSSSSPSMSPHEHGSANLSLIPAPLSSLSDCAGRRTRLDVRGLRQQARPPRPGRRVSLRLQGAPHHCAWQVRAPTNRSLSSLCVSLVILIYSRCYSGTGYYFHLVVYYNNFSVHDIQPFPIVCTT